MLRIHEKKWWIYTSFFLFAFEFCTNALAKGECKAVLSEELKGKYDEHDFLAACREGNVKAVQYFLDKDNFDVNEQFISGGSGTYIHGLFPAAQNGHAEVVQMLVNAGAKINRTWDSATPLFQAAQNGHAEVVEILVNAGAELNKTWNGATPLYQAAQNGHAKVVQILVKAGVELHKTWKDAAPLFIAAQNGH
ncbi:ankyrin repeat domain-containing protein, partial [Sansalvadorimonas verongulae]|uniref:ankyrin repeat domain-containing protein n=1 Tax=Sansalvadorimonas verongulae TaxID=2172824 RepID=UPI0018AD0FF1